MEDEVKDPQDLRRQLKDLSWLEIVHVFADLLCVQVSVRWHGGFDWCEVEFRWQNGNISYTSGFGKNACSPEESAKCLIKNLLMNSSLYSIGPHSDSIKFPRISFNSKEEMQMKLEVARVNVYFMLTHRCG